MKLAIEINKNSAMLAGEDRWGWLPIEIGPSELTPEERAALVRLSAAAVDSRAPSDRREDYVLPCGYWFRGSYVALAAGEAVAIVTAVKSRLAAFAASEDEQARLADEKAARDEAHRVKCAAEAAAEAAKREAREKAVNDARELLRDEIASLTERAETAEADRAILGEFLREVPDDAKRGTIRACVAADAGESEKGYAEKLEKASPDVWLFSDDKEDDSDESDE